MLELKEIKDFIEKDYQHNQLTRERAADDIVFYWITQWDDSLLDTSQLQYKGEFNILRKAGKQIIADLRANPVQVDFDPKDESRDDGADLLDGIYRAVDRVNTSIEAYDNASGECVVCGVGDWELYTEYESNRAGNENQVIKRRPIYEANNNSFPDSNAKLLDKSDGNRWTILEAYSEDGYKDLVEELTGERPTSVVMDSFMQPETSYSFPWIQGKNEIIYVAKFYYREKVKDKVLTFEDPFGQEILLRESDLDDYMEELLEGGYKIVNERQIERWQVTKYIVSGEQVLEHYPVVGEHIPVIRVYGERAFVEGQEHWEGVTRLAKDPSRLRNFQMSYLADIVSQSPRQKPIFSQEQVAGFEFMYEQNGADNNYAYYLQNLKTPSGEQLPLGPAGVMPEQPIPSALIQSIALSREAVGDVAPANVPQDIADIDLSGKALANLQNRLDEQSIVYQQNMKHAKRRDAEIFASMASEVYDSPRNISVTLPDGTRKKMQIMESVQDKDTGEIKVLNDLTNMEFDVFADIGPNYSTKKEQTIETLGAIAEKVAPTDPNMHKALVLKQLTLVDGINMDDIREYANKQLVLNGFKEPETPEEEQLLAQAQQSQQPDPNMLIGQAEMIKAQTAQAKEHREAAKDQAKIQIDQAKVGIDEFNAITGRIDSQVDAKKAQAEINFKNIQSFEKEMEIRTAPFRARLN